MVKIYHTISIFNLFILDVKMMDPKMQNTNNKEVYFAGNTGQMYPFTLYPYDVSLPDVGAIYIFTRQNYGSYHSLFIGQTDMLGSCILNHEKWVCVNKLYVNAISVYFENDAATRLEIERDLIGKQCPPCNEM